MSETLGSRRRKEPDVVLLIDDQQSDIRRARRAFDDAATNAVLRIAGSSDEALARLRGESEHVDTSLPDLVLLDLELEGGTGYDVLEAIRADPELKPLPVIVFTNSAESEDVVRSYEAKANAYLRKPTDQEAFDDVVTVLDRFWLQQVKLPPLSR